MTETQVMAGVFITAFAFALLLHRAVRRYGPVLADWTWLIVAIGTGPVVLWLSLLYPLGDWLKIPKALFLACIPVASFSL
jgi:hypothetical protein